MEDGWETHVSPLMMGVGMGDMQGIAEMQPQGQDIPGELNMPQHHQELSGAAGPHTVQHPDLNADIHQDIEQDLRHEMRSHQDSMGTTAEYFSHQV